MKSIKANTHTFRKGCYFLAFLLMGFVSCETSSLSELAEEQNGVDTDPSGGDPTDPNASNLVTYENTVKTILDNACVACHNQSNATAGIRLDTYEFAFLVADSGRMLARMTNTSSPMPPSGNLPNSIISDITDWIDNGILEN
ncbi:c-type cytochrome domain-containing protein [uncultured Dokdonia sp.]|uniref:c-type cytochrome domain-containing protein n=1 Tax=uncultured Dokdonia sp. TaxID=575653 RepID=UPI00261EDD47|nr:c-type cytochrome domain-containing protein [uncultured Dokdonia sp.]